MPKVSKQSVDYGLGMNNRHCGKSFDGDRYCKHFIPPLLSASDLGQCKRVTGAINKVYWCRLFARAYPR